MPAASCHCGAVHIEIAGRPRTLTSCNCSICYRYAALWAYHTRKSVHILCAPGAVSAYIWGDRSIEFYHCVTCGCLTHYESVKKDSDSRIAVNARMLPPQEIESLRIRHFDGADTWTYLD